MSTIFLYARQSTDEQTSLDMQIETGRKFALANYPEHTVVAVTEIGSGGSVSKRDKFLSIVASIAANDVLYVWDSSRLGRNVVEVGLVRKELRKKKAIIVEGGTIYKDTAVDIFQAQNIDNVSEFYKNLQAEKSGNSVRERRNSGDIRFAEMFGYDHHVKAKRISINEKEAEYIREIYRRHELGHTIKSIGEWLTMEGIKTKREKSWSLTAVRRILLRSLYCGYYLQDSLEDSSGTYAQADLYFASEKIKSSHYKPIISVDTFEKSLQIFLTEEKKWYRRVDTRRSKNLYTGIISCGICYNAGVRAVSSRLVHMPPDYRKNLNVVYKLASTHKKHDVKSGATLQEPMLDGLLKFCLEDIRTHSTMVDTYLAERREKANAMISDKQAALKTLNEKIEKIGKAIGNGTRQMLDADEDMAVEIKKVVQESIKEREILKTSKHELEELIQSEKKGNDEADMVWVWENLSKILDKDEDMKIRRKKLGEVLTVIKSFRHMVGFEFSCGISYIFTHYKKPGAGYPRHFTGFWTLGTGKWELGQVDI